MRLHRFLSFEAALWSVSVTAYSSSDAVALSMGANGAAYTPCATVSSIWAQQTGEYEFQLDLWDLFTSAHDNHLVWNRDVLGSPLEFQIGWSIVSVSEDGQALPSIYTLEDVHLSQGRISLGYTPSPVSTINGEDAVSFLKKFSLDGRLQDLDALYNSNFFSIANHANGDGFLTPTPHYPGAVTSFIFANGTQHNYTNNAVLTSDFSGVTDGPSFYTKFCAAVKTPLPSTTGETPGVPSPIISTTGYPSTPVIIHSEGAVGGYFLDGPGQGDVTVLSILSFDPKPSPATSGQELQVVIQEFLAAAKTAGKTKLIIDLQ